MHNEFTEILKIILCGLLGIGAAIGLKIQDINDSNENLNFKIASGLFFKKAFASVIFSACMVILYGATHEDWATLFTGESETQSHSIITKLIGLVMIMGGLVGFVCQYGYYKFFLKKADRFMKAWGADEAVQPVVEEKKDI